MRRVGGFTYIGLLIVIAIMGITLAAIGEVSSTARKREREIELIFIGDEFRRAIASYYETSPGTPRYPLKLEELLEDNRFPVPRRHLRKIYIDPMTGARDWALVPAPGNSIVGVHSKSTIAPLKRANFPLRYEQFEGAATYADWKFLHRPGLGQLPGSIEAPMIPPGVPRSP